MSRGLPRLMIVSSGASAAEVRRALEAVPEAAAMVQLRAPDCDADVVATRARAIGPICAARSAPLVINRHLEVAAGADGIHLPEIGADVGAARRRLGPSRLVGISTHSIDAAMAAAAAGADYVILGPIWPTPGKPRALGPTAIERAAAGLAGRAPIFAIGGITNGSRAAAAIAAGAAGVAGIRAFTGAAVAPIFAAITPGIGC